MTSPLRGAPLRFALLLLAVAPGCIHAYQPMSGLHRPVLVDPRAANFTDLRLTVVCPPGDYVSPAEAQMLCERVSKLFENQGATLTTRGDRAEQEPGIGEDPAAGQAGGAAAPTTDLVLELRAQELHTRNDPLSWVLCIATGTLVPAVTESTFAQDVVIRDGTGFLLLTDRLEGRIVRTMGVGTWAGNRLLDVLWRKKEEERWHKTLKTADVRPRRPGSRHEAIRAVHALVRDDNTRRLQSAIDHVTPAGRLEGRHNAIAAERDRRLESAREQRAA